MIENILPADPHPPPTLEVGSKGQNSTFSEQGHVAYQIKWKPECNKMQAHSLSLHTPSNPVVGSKVKTFFSESSHDAYQIRREWSIKHHASTYSVLTHIPPMGVESKGQNSTFSERGHVAYQIKWNCECSSMQAQCPYTHIRLLGWGQRLKYFFFLKVAMLHIKLEENGT